MTCHSPSAELAALRAELAAALARAERAEATARLQAQALVNLTASFAAPAAVPPPPASRSDSVTEGRHASRITRDAPGVTGVTDASVTEAQKDEHRKAQDAARSRAYRLRQRLMTAERDGVTRDVMQEEEKKKEITTPPPSSVTLAPVTPVTPPRSGRLTVTRVAAREYRAPMPTGHLPAEVQALREFWQTLVVGSGRGFAPWPERTSVVLLANAEAALQERPLEEWREVFARVPRSPLCRGELRNGRKADLLWILLGTCPDGHTPADKLLHGGWTLDPEASAGVSTEGPRQEPPAQAPPGDSPAATAWRQVLASLSEKGLKYAVSQLELLRPREVAAGVLVLSAGDRFRRSFVEEHFGFLLREHAERCGLAGVRVDVGEGGP
ncbi:hypothetical protein D187_008747 [Cystobacter fuscus DSM 2262]|uniref:DnaA N-terminal domain-containing protein n=1 Tax=Cystobacter fuscus (strain ATCC 25194 / DSM 2262 / NBRC 100088 / M29) TaxID=1242864 RepID=S9QMS7_CYSF2|nr:hypothetical protein [Cystobacter fuscus]EPX62559.1 hypothetical protein D187_008747 [Cystobacter fuscus DSM 2262]